jgi:hypothetical protein
MIKLELINPHWINNSEDDANDQCAHGQILFQVNNSTIIAPEDGDFTVSAAALFLLRTLEQNHTPDNPVCEENLLFPHCGHSVWPHNGKYDVICIGCDIGVDLRIDHDKNAKAISIIGKSTELVKLQEWKVSICKFVNQVQSFYQSSTTKIESEDEHERLGWRLFWKEWNSRLKINCLEH